MISRFSAVTWLNSLIELMDVIFGNGSLEGRMSCAWFACSVSMVGSRWSRPPSEIFGISKNFPGVSLKLASFDCTPSADDEYLVSGPQNILYKKIKKNLGLRGLIVYSDNLKLFCFRMFIIEMSPSLLLLRVLRWIRGVHNNRAIV